jgi:NOL1/NOP2/sun family putative RNA methylase
MKVPVEFGRYHRRLLGREYVELMDYFTRRPTRYSIRVNTLKSSMREVKRILAERNIDYGSISWCGDGLWVDSGELDFMEHQLGLFYIQSASSMVAPQVLGTGGSVLDLCAAPGGKSTHLAQLMGNRGMLAANEDNRSRIKALVYNLQRCGVSNAAVTNHDGVRFSGLGLSFDRVLVDVPCSSVGTLRTSREALRKWSMGWVRRLAEVQKKLILSAYDCLGEGGRLVYCTCTTSREENEDVVEHLLAEREAELLKVRLDGIKLRRGLTDKTSKCARIYPMDNDTDPQFIAEVVKGG